jgi:integration host factor subunit alpha
VAPPTVTKASLVEAAVDHVGLSRKHAVELVDALFETIRVALLDGDKVRIPGFGVFSARPKAARLGRNPNTGEAMMLPARRVATFKPSTQLRAALNPR